MVSMVKSHMLELSKDKFGCRVIQKCGTQEGWKPASSEMNKEMESLFFFVTLCELFSCERLKITTQLEKVPDVFSTCDVLMIPTY